MRQILSKVWPLAKRFAGAELFNYQRGQIVAVWAAIESSIDLANSMAWAADKSMGKVVPLNLRWKLEFFDQIHRDLPLLKPLRPQAKELIRMLKDRQDDRHWLVHGRFDVFKSQGTSWQLTKGEGMPDGGMKFVSKTFSLDDLDAMHGDLFNLGVKLGKYAAAVAVQLGNHALDDTRR